MENCNREKFYDCNGIELLEGDIIVNNMSPYDMMVVFEYESGLYAVNPTYMTKFKFGESGDLLNSTNILKVGDQHDVKKGNID